MPVKKVSLLCLRFLLLGIFLVLPFFTMATTAEAATGINKQINFQGKVVAKADGTNVTNGSYSFTFRLYTVSSGGAAIWTETKTITVTDGIFQTNLGDTTALPGSVDFNTDNIYLGVEFNADGEMTPRIRFTAAPYALNAEKVGGLTVTNTTGTLTIPNGTTVAFSGANDLTLTTSGATTLTLPTTGTLATLAGAESLTNKTIGSTGLTFSGAATDITTGTDEALTFVANGTGDFVFSTDADSTFAISSLSTQGGLVYASNSSGVLGITTAGNAGECLQSNAGVSAPSWGSCGGTVRWDQIADPTTAAALAFNEYAQSLDWNTADTAGAFEGLTMSVTNDATTDASTQKVLVVKNASSAGGGTTENLFSLVNADDGTITTAMEIITTSTGAITTALDLSDPDIVTALSIGGNAISGTYLSLSDTGTLTTSGDWSWGATTPTITLASAETMTVTDGTDSFVLNTANSSLSFTDGTNSVLFDLDTGPSYAGAARPTRKVTLPPEYPGATLTGDGTDNSGTMTSNFCENGVHANIPDTNTSVCNTTGDIHNYYQWVGQSSGVKDYDIWIRWRVPDNFSAWASSNPVKVWGKRTDTTNNAVTVYLYDTTGALENTGGTQVAGTSWTQTSLEASFGGTYTAGDFVTLRIVMAADTSDSVQVGEITLDYLSTN